MAEHAFPRSVYDRPRNLLAVLGSVWARDYESRDQIYGLVQSKCLVEQQSVMDMLDLLSSISRFTVPIYRRENWYPLYLRESERNDAQTSLLKYDGASNYDAGFRYDVPVDSPHHAFPKPDDLVTAGSILNRFVDPTLLWQSDVDYELRNDAIVFRSNPFEDSRIAVRQVYEAGTIVDREAVLWIFRGEFDFETIYEQFGYVIGSRMASSRGYRDLTNAIWDAMVGGPTRRDMYAAMSAMTGIPLVKEASETVEAIVVEQDSRIVITDLNVYKFPLAAVPTVAVGDVVSRGDTLTDTMSFHSFGRGTVPSDLRALALGTGYLATCFYADLIFENKEVPLEVIEDDPSGFTKLKFPIGGFPLDVTKFFDEMHRRGVVEATRAIDECDESERVRYPANDCDEVETFVRRGTLAHLLDVRANPIGEPRAMNLPRTINPLKFLVENILRNNVTLVRVKTASLGRDAVGLHNFGLLQRAVPPQSALILVVEVSPHAETLASAQIAETLSTFDAVGPLSEEVSTAEVRESGFNVRLISGSCH